MKKLRNSEETLARIEATEKKLRDSVAHQEIAMTVDDRIGEADAGRLLGYADGSLKNLRTLGGAPPSYRRTVGGSRVSYRIQDLAEWIEFGREE